MGAEGSPDPAAQERLIRLVHDLRTPLTLVLGFSDLLRKRGDQLSAQERADYVERIDAAAKDLRRILDEERADRSGAPGASGGGDVT